MSWMFYGYFWAFKRFEVLFGAFLPELVAEPRAPPEVLDAVHPCNDGCVRDELTRTAA